MTKPMVKQGGEWREVEWNVALDYASHALRDVRKERGATAIGALVSPHATLEEMFLAGQLMRGIGSDNIDFRLRQSDFSHDGQRNGTPWLGMKIEEVSQLDRVLVVGSFLRKDHPLIAQRLRQSARRGALVSVIHAANDDPLIKLFAKAVVVPSQLPMALAEVVKAVAQLKNATLADDFAKVGAGETAQKIAASLLSGKDGGRNAGILLGNFAQQHPQAATLQRLAQQLAQLLGGKFGFLGEAANSVGGYIAKACPQADGLNATRLIAEPRQAYLVLGAEPELDCADGAAALAALKQADSVIVMSHFKSPAMLDYADCLLPVSPFAETSGTFINTEGRAQSFHAVTKPQGEARPAWKVLRVLGNLLEVAGFDYESSEQVRDEVLNGRPEFVAGLDNGVKAAALNLTAGAGGVERVADVPIHFADPLARRAPSLQATKDAAAPTACMNAAMLAKLGVAAGDSVKVGPGGAASAGSAASMGTALVAQLDGGVPDNCVRIAAAHANTAAVGPLFGALSVSKA